MSLTVVIYILGLLPLRVSTAVAHAFPVHHQPTNLRKRLSHLPMWFHSSYQVPRSPSAPISKSSYLNSLEAKRATLGYLERIKGRHNIPSYIQLRIPRVNEQPKCPSSDEIALYIDPFDLRLLMPLQPSFMRMFSYLRITLRQLSLLGWRRLTDLQVL